MVHTLNGGIETTFADSCTLLCETARSVLSTSRCGHSLYGVLTLLRYLLELSKEHKLEYIRRVTGMASNAGFVVSSSCWLSVCDHGVPPIDWTAISRGHGYYSV